jgi:hypothetical protein
MSETEDLVERIRELTGWRTVKPPKIITDTSDAFAIERGDILRLGGRDYLVLGHKYESRFGIADQPKYWVLGTYEMATGLRKIIKTVFYEEFNVHIGVFRVHCYRSPDKEAEVLRLVRGDMRFMQGYTVRDDENNNIRVLDFVHGRTVLDHVVEINKSHEQYCAEDLPDLLWRLAAGIEAIQFLHRHGTCHGDIRNDHLIIEKDTAHFRWIDFDLNQHVADYDLWSLGNILNYMVGKGIVSFDKVFKSPEFSAETKASLAPEDASAFYEYRIMNLHKVYPYLPQRLNDILAHFTIRPKEFYANIDDLLHEYIEMLDSDFPAG